MVVVFGEIVGDSREPRVDIGPPKLFRGHFFAKQVELYPTTFRGVCGLPLTPVYLTSVAGTGVTGTIRPNVTSAVSDCEPG